MKVQLIVVKGKPEGKVIPLVAPRFKIGRGEECQLRPNNELVSREHCEIVVGEDLATVQDCGSRNGTVVNGKTITGAHPLKNGDLLQVGPLTFAIHIQGAPPITPGKAVAPTRGGTAAKAAAIDDVSHADIESWLVADESRPEPDRPSGVYAGTTQTFDAYKDSSAPAKPKPAAKAPEPKPVPPPAPAPEPEPIAAEAPAPEPEPEAEDIMIPASEPDESETSEPEPEPEIAAPAPAPKPIAAEVKPAPKRPEPKSTRPSWLDEIESIEPLEEGKGDADAGMPQEDEDEARDEESDEQEVPEEFVDESNPFYVKKAQPDAAATPAKPSFKDTSDAASDILRRMMDRRRAGRS
jgi:predicted component of type VI protein secretion system